MQLMIFDDILKKNKIDQGHYYAISHLRKLFPLFLTHSIINMERGDG